MTNTQIIDNGRKPLLIAPPKSVETHSHIFGPADRYPHAAGANRTSRRRLSNTKRCLPALVSSVA
jgi:hypothetical protein